MSRTSRIRWIGIPEESWPGGQTICSSREHPGAHPEATVITFGELAIIYGSVLLLGERLSPQATDESRQQVTVKLGFFGHTVVVVLVEVHDQKNEKEEGDEGAEDGVAFDAG